MRAGKILKTVERIGTQMGGALTLTYVAFVLNPAADKCKQIKGKTSILVTLKGYGLAERNGGSDCRNPLQSISPIYYVFPTDVSQHVFMHFTCSSCYVLNPMQSLRH
jgi:hypothetical protein